MLGPTGWKAALQKSLWGPGGHEVDHEPAMCPCSKAGQQHAGLC